MRGGVPVFSRPCGSFSSFSRADSAIAGGSPARPAAVVLQADVDAAVEEGARRQHHGARHEANTNLRHGAGHTVALQDQVVAAPWNSHRFGWFSSRRRIAAL